MSEFSEKLATRFAALERMPEFHDFVNTFRGAGYIGYVANIPTERMATKTGTQFLTFDIAVGTGKKREGTDKWESLYIQCAWFGYNQELAKGDVVCVFGQPDLVLLNGKAYPKLNVKCCYVVNANRGGSSAMNQRNDKAKAAGEGVRAVAGGSYDDIPF